ncbi:hypothetical protein ACH5RR_019072 [Cinchona calisaya]|uniref:RING-type domain-containing protein n=1 Tax=Cinchona calisaya TaxID=153742 RepID=A0ABD2ZTH2_9GENT
MNSTVHNSSGSTKTSASKDALHDVVYSLSFSIAILLVLVIISYISYKCNRSMLSSPLPTGTNYPNTENQTNDHEFFTIPSIGGLNEATLLNYPKLLYSQAKSYRGDQQDSSIDASGCSICLVDYKNTDMLRLLPDCGHIFHLECIDPWLKLHPTCPICRSSPVPTPLAQVVPLSIQQN